MKVTHWLWSLLFKVFRHPWVPVAITLFAGAAFTLWRAHGHYEAPSFGGPEPARNHLAALHILETGLSGLTDYPPGYAYLTALLYLVLPNTPLSVVWFQVVLMGVMVYLVPKQIAARWSSMPLHFDVLLRFLLMAYYPFTYYAAVYSGIVPALFLAIQVLVACYDILVVDAGSRVRTSVVGGLWMGVLAILRPDFAPIGLVFACVALIIFWRQWKELIKSVMPIGMISIAMLSIFVALNLPENGKLLHGDAYIARSLLLGSCQYAERMWDFDFAIDSTHPSMMECHDFIAAREAYHDSDFFEPVVAEELRAEAWRRYGERPLMAIKKIMISSIRIWVLTPTQLENRLITYAITVQEVLLFLLAVFAAIKIPSIPLRTGAILLLLLPGATHPFFHIEPRLCLPLKGLEVLLFCHAIFLLYDRYDEARRNVRGHVTGSMIE